MKFNINGKEFTLISDYKDNKVMRESFNDLTKKTYAFTFEDWYQLGYWGDRYRPYSLVDGDKIVSNVSVNVIDFLVYGEPKRYIQIGTVMTDEAYRGKGLSNFLMNHVIKEWSDRSDLIYLFANDSVVSFYPKFGFQKAEEYQCTKINMPRELEEIGKVTMRKLDMGMVADRTLLVDMINHSKPFSSLSMFNNPELIMFYCTKFMRDCVYYLVELNTVIIASIEKGVLYLDEIFCSETLLLFKIISAMKAFEFNKVVFGFTPEEKAEYEINLLKKEDTTLFLMGNDARIIKENKLMFPNLSHA